MAYLERLRVPIWWWAVVLLLVGSLAVAVFAYVPLEVGLVLVVAFAVVLSVLLVNYGRAGIVVDDGALMLGRSRLEGRWISGAEALSGPDAVHAMTAGANPHDHLQTRPYVRDLVRVELADPADPHPHWLISSRRAEELAAAVNEIAQGRT